MFMIRI